MAIKALNKILLKLIEIIDPPLELPLPLPELEVPLPLVEVTVVPDAMAIDDLIESLKLL